MLSIPAQINIPLVRTHKGTHVATDTEFYRYGVQFNRCAVKQKFTPQKKLLCLLVKNWNKLYNDAAVVNH